jgi:hypothetical protein
MPRPRISILLIAPAACAVAAGAEPVRLELRIVPQSGVPGVLCVYNDPPTPLGSADPPVEAWVSPGIARRFEVQYRLVDADPGDGLQPRGLQSVNFSILAASPTAGVWGRGLLSIAEGEADAVATGLPPGTVDCSGLPAQPSARKRGLHEPFRALLTGADPSEDAHNGAFQPAGLTAIAAQAAELPRHTEGEWFGLYTFEFTPGAGFSDSLMITAAAVPGTGAAFRWYDTLGVIHAAPSPGGGEVASAFITVRGPAPITACCTLARCTIVLSPSACFASAGFIAAGNVCGPTPTATCCFADFNRDGTVSVQDVLDFITAYLSGSPSADINGSGTLTVQDVFDYLGAYFAGCGG